MLSEEDAQEASLREALASYFLYMPPFGIQSALGRQHTARQLGLLLALEWRGLLRFAGRPRPLWEGDLTALVRALTDAAREPMDALCASLSVHLPSRALPLGYEPRLLPLGITLLLRLAAATGRVEVCLLPYPGDATLHIAGASPFSVEPFSDGLREIARLHGGRLLLTPHSAALSLSAQQKAVGRAPFPTAELFSENPVSPFCLGFYALLSEDGSISAGPGS